LLEPHAGDVSRGVGRKRWKSYIDGVAVSTFTRRPWLCLRVVSGDEVIREVRTFETTTASLMALSQWLAENGCTHVAMEATGVYWKPVWHILDDGDFQ
jgi:hypothetical protein